MTDRFGCRKLSFITLDVYILAMLTTTLSWGFVSLVVFCVLTSAGIDGKYVAVNPTIQELAPARMRG